MLRTILWYFNFAFSLVLKIPRMIYAKRQKKKLSEKEFLKMTNELVRKWCKQHVAIAGARIHITGLENLPKNQNVLFISNHQSYFDIAVMISEINFDKGYVAKIEMLKIPLLRTWMKNINCVFIDRTDLKSQGRGMIETIKQLKNGYSMVIYPEGTRSKSSKLGEFQSTTIKLAAKANVPIIPITVDGTYKLMEENNYKVKPADVYLTIHKPIYDVSSKNEDVLKLSDQIKETIESGLHYNK